jgi:3-keto-5-aminohexanoate cleavage enzyme
MPALPPVIINAAISGSSPADASPHLPRSPEDIGRQALEAAEAGAAIVHLHTRDDAGVPSGDIQYHARAMKVIKDAGSDVLINLTTSFTAANVDDWPTRFSVLDLKPDIASYDAGSFNYSDHHVFANTPPFLRELAERMQQAGVKPEIEIFDLGQIGNAQRLAEQGLIDAPRYFQFITGVNGGVPATPKALLHLVEHLPKDAVWSVAGIGRHQLDMDAYGILMGGNVRTGLEDNHYFSKGVPATNAQLVQRVADLVHLLGREVATPAQAREILGIG